MLLFASHTSPFQFLNRLSSSVHYLFSVGFRTINLGLQHIELIQGSKNSLLGARSVVEPPFVRVCAPPNMKQRKSSNQMDEFNTNLKLYEDRNEIITDRFGILCTLMYLGLRETTV